MLEGATPNGLPRDQELRTLFERLRQHVRSPHLRTGSILARGVIGLVAVAMLMGRTSLRRHHPVRTPVRHSPRPHPQLRTGQDTAVSTLSRTLRRFDVSEFEAILSLRIAGRHRPDHGHRVSNPLI